MGLGDNISNSAEDATGKVKEAVGNATDGQSTVAEGKADQASAGRSRRRPGVRGG